MAQYVNIRHLPVVRPSVLLGEGSHGLDMRVSWYVALENGRPHRRRRRPTLDEIDPGEFLPSSRSIAFTREAWTRAGGYPEWLTLTGEDTWFALELGRFCERWAFVPEAVVEWRRGIQARRRREDAKITPLFLDPFLAVESPPEYSELQGELLRFFGLDRVLKATTG